MRALLYLAFALFAAACAPRPPVIEEPLRTQVARVQACSSRIALKLGSQHYATNPITAANVTATVPGTRGMSSYPVPGEIIASWADTVYDQGTAATGPPRSRAIRIWNAVAGSAQYDLNRELYLACHENATEVIALPVIRLVRITSDPEGASVFAHVPVSVTRSEERFFGTTPLTVSLAYTDGARSKQVRIEKSGYHGQVKYIDLDLVEFRVILHPLPRR